MSLEINYIDAPEGAQERMNVDSTGANTASDPALIPPGAQDVPYATLEPGVWTLDGSRKILPDGLSPGWWSKERSGSALGVGILGQSRLGSFILSSSGARSAAAGNRFATPPKVILSFPSPYGATGFTFTFSPSTDQWCSEINVKWYLDQTILIDKDYYPDAPRWILNETIESFDRMEITLLATNRPGQFAKIQRIEVGRNVLFGAQELVKARLVNEIDPTLCTLTVDTLTFEMHDPAKRSFLPQENQRVELIKDGKLRAVQYIKSSTRKSEHSYSISCQSSIGLLDDEFLGGMYTAYPLISILSDILGDWEYEVHPSFAEKTISGYIPVSTQRSALQMVAFAIGAIVTTQESSRIRLIPIPKAVAAKFASKDILTGGAVKTVPRLSRVEVDAHTYVKSEIPETLISDEEFDGESELVTFSAPHHSYEVTGGEIVESDVNWIKLTAHGKVTVTAKTYLHTSRPHIRRNPEATARERGNYIAVTDATLIHGGNAQEALDRLYTSVQQRQTVSQPVIVSNQRAGQLVSSLTPWGTVARGLIASMDSTMTQSGQIADIKIQGIEVTFNSVWMYSGEIYSGGQEVLY